MGGVTRRHGLARTAALQSTGQVRSGLPDPAHRWIPDSAGPSTHLLGPGQRPEIRSLLDSEGVAEG